MIEVEFLENIGQSLFPEKVNEEAEEYRCFFKLRFDRENYRLENKRKRRDNKTENSQKCEDLASLMAAKYFPQSNVIRQEINFLAHSRSHL